MVHTVNAYRPSTVSPRIEVPAAVVDGFLLVGLPKVRDDLAARTVRAAVAEEIRSARAEAVVLDLEAVDGVDRRTIELIDDISADARTVGLTCIAHDPRTPRQQMRDQIGARIGIDTVRSLDDVATSMAVELTA